MYANVDESQTNVDECRGVFRQVQRNVDECRQIMIFSSDSKKSDRWLLQIFNFVAISVIIVPQNVINPYISKTHLPFVSLIVRELELN